MVSAPLIKWPGGKRAIARQIASVFPATFGNYFEPFVGGAALFFLLQPSRSVLSDKNEELINLYIQVRDHPIEVIDILTQFDNDKDQYYKIRATVFHDAVSRAARMYYLMLLSFNGIYRVNLRGVFNVPYGFKTHLAVVDRTKILRASNQLQNAQLWNVDFQSAVQTALPGDLVYFDFPYTVAHSQNGFLKYNEDIFSYEDQKRLADCALDLARKGCFVAVSNANHESIATLYPDFCLKSVPRTSKIASRSEHRVKIEEHVYYLGG